MPQQSSRKRRPSPYLFMTVAAVLCLALVFAGAQALNAWNTYNAEKALTPVPTATVAPISAPAAVAPASGSAEAGATPASVPTPAIADMPTPNIPDAAGAAIVDMTPGPAPAAAQPTATPGTLANGSKGQQVAEMQTRLQELGYYTGKIDGDFGSGTKKAVQLFQQVNGLEDDGIAGKMTLAALYSDQALPRPGPVDTLAGDQPLLVNKDNPLPGGFEPADLVTVKDVLGGRMTYASDSAQGVREAVEALAAMIQAALDEGYSPWKLRESYRTIEDQQRIFNNRVQSYMNEGATRSQALAHTRREVADPGCSEHHTGLAFDLNVPGENFGDTAQYLWLKKNCWDYGFIMRYTDEKDDITGITGEEWHVRYVGIEHAKKMQEMDFCLEEYIEYLNQQ